jgi:hypothetical protein
MPQQQPQNNDVQENPNQNNNFLNLRMCPWSNESSKKKKLSMLMMRIIIITRWFWWRVKKMVFMVLSIVCVYGSEYWMVVVFLKDVGLVLREEVLIVILIWVSLFSSSGCKLLKLFLPFRHTFIIPVHFCILAIPGHLFYHSEIFQNRYTCEKCSGTIF